MTHKTKGHLEVEDRGEVMSVRVDGRPHSLFGIDIANQLERSVYFGGSMSLAEGLHVERTEFLGTDQSDDGQQLMLDYLESTDSTGELPLYNPDIYKQALESGRVPGTRSTNGQ
ncbi:hypothetical protein [Rhodococcus sp. WAY2]|uniref:hypothetical protein n=1 Tax=Rhodococcus sp. WAY2 TaxID=2663121 RepID=UPI00132045F3|nr:hypothetical protein [Rhodococcus sp. WAY2]QHE69852.1 Enoyl-CoA hydratase [Rhodococcus sp. WAY2]